MMKKLSLNINKSVLLMLLVFCLLTTLIQGIPALYAIPRNTKMTIFTALFLLSFIILFYFYRMGRLTEERIVFAILFLGMLFHCSYVVLSGLYERQHDEGVYTGIATDYANPGHIGYSEFIYKFHKLPDMNPYQLFSYYHPPLHYLLSGLWLILLTSLGMPEDLAFENLQVLPLLYSGLFMYLTYLILIKVNARGLALYTGLALTAFHPALTIMSGSVNNDMLSNLLLACCILFMLSWIRDKSLKNLLPLALFIGLGMLCKVNTAIIALPTGLIFLLDFIAALRTRCKSMILNKLSRYCIFGVTAAVTGLSWIIRNLILFQVKPGISSATESSIMYTGAYSLWERIGMPAFADWHFSFPFHPLAGDVIHNIWVIMFQTSLFAEVFPAALTSLPLFLCRLAYIGAIFSGTASGILFVVTQINKYKKNAGREEALFLLSGYAAFLFSFVVFSIKYPYTCSSDFRYIVICLIYTAIGLAEGKGRAARLIRTGVCITLALTAIIYMTWRQW